MQSTDIRCKAGGVARDGVDTNNKESRDREQRHQTQVTQQAQTLATIGKEARGEEQRQITEVTERIEMRA